MWLWLWLLWLLLLLSYSPVRSSPVVLSAASVASTDAGDCGFEGLLSELAWCGFAWWALGVLKCDSRFFIFFLTNREDLRRLDRDAPDFSGLPELA